MFIKVLIRYQVCERGNTRTSLTVIRVLQPCPRCSSRPIFWIPRKHRSQPLNLLLLRNYEPFPSPSVSLAPSITTQLLPRLSSPLTSHSQSPFLAIGSFLSHSPLPTYCSTRLLVTVTPCITPFSCYHSPGPPYSHSHLRIASRAQPTRHYQSRTHPRHVACSDSVCKLQMTAAEIYACRVPLVGTASLLLITQVSVLIPRPGIPLPSGRFRKFPGTLPPLKLTAPPQCVIHLKFNPFSIQHSPARLVARQWKRLISWT